jgi:hypothetical protein
VVVRLDLALAKDPEQGLVPDRQPVVHRALVPEALRRDLVPVLGFLVDP